MGTLRPGVSFVSSPLWLSDDGRALSDTLHPHSFSDCSARGIEAQELLRELRDCGAALLGVCPGPDEQQLLLQRLGEWLGGLPLQRPEHAAVQGGDAWQPGEFRTRDASLPEPAGVVAVSADAATSAASVLRLVDGFAAAKALQASSPAAYEYLSSRPLPWRPSDAGGPQKPTLAPMLHVLADGTPEGLRWSLSELEELAPSARSELQLHAAALAALLASGRFERRLRLRPGELLLLDNRRILLNVGNGAAGATAGHSLLRFGRDNVDWAMRLRGLLPPLADDGMTSPKVRVVRSPGLGYFVVAAAPVAQGEPLFSVDTTVPDGRMKVEPSLYSIQVSEDQHMLPTLVPDELGGLIRYPSHMNNPTLRVRLSPGRVEMVARHRIDAGQELGFNYCSTEWSMASPFVDTRTKASIQGFRHLQPSEQQWLLTEGLAAPHLERLMQQI